jgi:DNA processing protein
MVEHLYIALNKMEGVGPVRVRALMEHFGDISSIFQADEAALREARLIGPELARRIVAQRDRLDPEGEVRAAAKLGAHLITPVHPAYPELLRSIHDPPLALYVRGELLARDKHAIAIIGTRECSHYGQQVADRLAFQLAKRGYTVVSGLARGIDTAAHAGALKAGGRTLAVIGSALDRLYPPENAELAERIAAQGAVLSEFPLGTEPGRTTFPMRNRIVAGLSQGVVVVEAAPGSGAMITVEEATAQGRSVFAVPGRIDSPLSRGCHQLIKQGAKLVESADDIVEEFEYLLPPSGLNPPAAKSAPAPEQVRPPLNLNPAEQALVDALEHGPLIIDDLIRRTGLRSAQVSSLLIGLEMKRAIKLLPGKLVQRV